MHVLVLTYLGAAAGTNPNPNPDPNRYEFLHAAAEQYARASGKNVVMKLPLVDHPSVSKKDPNEKIVAMHAVPGYGPNDIGKTVGVRKYVVAWCCTRCQT